MNSTHFITWHTKDGFAIQEHFPKGVEQKRFIERVVQSPSFRSEAHLKESIKYERVQTQLYELDHVELLYFQSDSLGLPLEARTPVYTSHYVAK